MEWLSRMTGPVAVLTAGGLALSGCGSDKKTARPAAASKATTATSAPADEKTLAGVATNVHRDITAVWPKISDLWPGADYSGRVIILGDGKQAFAVSMSGTRQLSEDDLAADKINVPPAGFAPAKLDGKQAMVVSPEGLTEGPIIKRYPLSWQVFTMGTHEMFHAYEQGAFDGEPKWSGLAKLDRSAVTSPAGRATGYPIKAAARLQRASMVNEITLAYKRPEQRDEHLAAAAYWYRQWKNQNPGEASKIAATDLMEGTDRYLDARELNEHVHPGGGTDRALMTRTYFTPVTSMSDLDSESYDLAVAGLVLDDLGKTGWKQQAMDTGRAPYDLLLDGITPTAQKPAVALKKTIESKATKQNRELADTVGIVGEAFNDRTTIMLVLPDVSEGGSYGVDGFYTVKGVDGVVYNGLTKNFTLPTGKIKIAGYPAAGITIDGKTKTVLPLDSSTRAKNGKLALKLPGLTGTVTVTKSTGSQGHTLLTAQ